MCVFPNLFVQLSVCGDDKLFCLQATSIREETNYNNLRNQSINQSINQTSNYGATRERAYSRPTERLTHIKTVATFASFFVYTRQSRCPPFLFIFDEHIVKQSKTSMLQNNINK